MTTVAWDGRMMAADSFSDLGGLKSTNGTKVWRLKDGSILGGAGARSQILALRDYLEAGHLDNPKPDAHDDLHAIRVLPDGSCWFYCNSTQPVPAPQVPFAIGSGRDFAIAAMAMGANAYDAVHVACKFDTYSCGPITRIDCEQSSTGDAQK